MARLVFDIETAGLPLTTYDTAQQAYLFRHAQTDEEREQAVRMLNLTPLTARVACIGMLNLETQKGRALHLAEAAGEEAEEDVTYIAFTDERALLAHFWDLMGMRTGRSFNVERFITFNGRAFDCPFLMMRSAVLGLRPARNLMEGTRYNTRDHVDLLEEFTFYAFGNNGATRRFNLDFYCKTFGVASPKQEGVTGNDVNDLFAAGRHRDIARYCMRDVRATAELYRRWESFLSFPRS